VAAAVPFPESVRPLSAKVVLMLAVTPEGVLPAKKFAAAALGEFNRSSQHPEIGGCDDGLQTCLGSMHKKEVACARAPACLAA